MRVICLFTEGQIAGFLITVCAFPGIGAYNFKKYFRLIKTIDEYSKNFMGR
jgi:ADP-glucose pyrophosphorylase